MSFGDVLVVGGTSDARALCLQLDAAQVRYTVSVATPTGEALAGDIQGQVRCGRLEREEMVAWLREHNTRWVIDASHPYAEAVSRNVLDACAQAGVLLSRYQRPDQLDELTHPLLHYVTGIDEACERIKPLGQRVLLTTGSKDLALWRAGLPEKTVKFLLNNQPQTMIIDCSHEPRDETPRNHCDLNTVMALNEVIGCPQVILTHISHQFDVWMMDNPLPSGIEAGYDGMVLVLD